MNGLKRVPSSSPKGWTMAVIDFYSGTGVNPYPHFSFLFFFAFGFQPRFQTGPGGIRRNGTEGSRCIKLLDEIRPKRAIQLRDSSEVHKTHFLLHIPFLRCVHQPDGTLSAWCILSGLHNVRVFENQLKTPVKKTSQHNGAPIITDYCKMRKKTACNATRTNPGFTIKKP